MTDAPVKSSSLREASRRVAILVLVISSHLGLLLLLLRPVILYRHTTAVAGNKPRVLELRFFRPLPPSLPHLVLAVHRLVAPSVHSHTTPPARSSKPPTVKPAARRAPPPLATRLTSAREADPGGTDSLGDGGFQERLRLAQHSRSVHGVPGSDTPSAPGIHLVDPMNQGIGAVMRTTQRAFGITSSHCVDVDVWRHLTPQELSARHISSSDVDEVDRKYGCNKPLGLHF